MACKSKQETNKYQGIFKLILFLYEGMWTTSFLHGFTVKRLNVITVTAFILVSLDADQALAAVKDEQGKNV
jgi:hypothetical protein